MFSGAIACRRWRMADLRPPHRVALWMPRGDEHELAASLGMCEADPALLRELLDAARSAIAQDHPGAHVCVRRWHVWRVVRALAKLGLKNTPAGRATAYAALLARSEKIEGGDEK